jgi:hypothetical protein
MSGLGRRSGWPSSTRRSPCRWSTRTPDWIRIARVLLVRAAANGELRPGVGADQIAHLVVSALTGVQLTSEVLTGRKERPDLDRAGLTHGPIALA